jgi:hypothetical protein
MDTGIGARGTGPPILGRGARGTARPTSLKAAPGGEAEHERLLTSGCYRGWGVFSRYTVTNQCLCGFCEGGSRYGPVTERHRDVTDGARRTARPTLGVTNLNRLLGQSLS